MKFQWTLLLGIFFALVVSVFAVINVDPVTVNYFFGEADWPLILVI
ncbi:LapA family protein, partial [Bacillus thuringiensis]